jgi:hypothetical protein
MHPAVGPDPGYRYRVRTHNLSCSFFFSVYIRPLSTLPFPCTSTPPTHLPSGGSERGTDREQYPNQISDRLARMQTSNPPIGTGPPLEGLSGRLPISQIPRGKGRGGGTGAVGTVGLGPRWVERDQDQAVGNLMVTCSTSLPRSDITVGSVSFDVGFLF